MELEHYGFSVVIRDTTPFFQPAMLLAPSVHTSIHFIQEIIFLLTNKYNIAGSKWLRSIESVL